MKWSTRQRLTSTTSARRKRSAESTRKALSLLIFETCVNSNARGWPPAPSTPPEACSSSGYPPDSPYHDAEFAQDREYIFCCGGGWRSAFAARDMKAMGMEKVSHIEPGFGGWKEANMPLQDYEVWKAARKK